MTQLQRAAHAGADNQWAPALQMISTLCSSEQECVDGE
jgi:hypothetical protein